MAYRPETLGGSHCLDALLYDEVLPWPSGTDDLCDVVHREFLLLGFEDMGGAVRRRRPH
jgi:hypothetical protein